MLSAEVQMMQPVRLLCQIKWSLLCQSPMNSLEKSPDNIVAFKFNILIKYVLSTIKLEFVKVSKWEKLLN